MFGRPHHFSTLVLTLVLIFGIMLLIVSVSIVDQNKDYDDLYRPELGLAAFNIVISSLAIIVGAVGVCISLFRNPRLVKIIAVTMVIIGIFAVASLITALIINAVSAGYLRNRFNKKLLIYGNNTKARTIIDTIQSDCECCGFNSWIDYSIDQIDTGSTRTTSLATIPSVVSTSTSTTTSSSTSSSSDTAEPTPAPTTSSTTTTTTATETLEPTPAPTTSSTTTTTTASETPEPTPAPTTSSTTTTSAATPEPTPAPTTSSTTTTTTASETPEPTPVPTTSSTTTTTSGATPEPTPAPTTSSSTTTSSSEALSPTAAPTTSISSASSTTGTPEPIPPTVTPNSLALSNDETETIEPLSNSPISTMASLSRREISVRTILECTKDTDDFIDRWILSKTGSRQGRELPSHNTSMIQKSINRQFSVPSSCCVDQSSVAACSAVTNPNTNQFYMKGCSTCVIARANKHNMGIAILNSFLIPLSFLVVPVLSTVTMRYDSTEDIDAVFDRDRDRSTNPPEIQPSPSIIHTRH